MTLNGLLVLVIGFFLALVSGQVSYDILLLLQTASVVIFAGSKIPQIVTAFRVWTIY